MVKQCMCNKLQQALLTTFHFAAYTTLFHIKLILL